MNGSQYTGKPEFGPQHREGEGGEGRQQHRGEPRPVRIKLGSAGSSPGVTEMMYIFL